MNEALRMTWLRIFLRVLSVGFLAAFIPWITLILLNAPILAPGGTLAPLLIARNDDRRELLAGGVAGGDDPEHLTLPGSNRKDSA